jgi:hypothetical protein
MRNSLSEYFWWFFITTKWSSRWIVEFYTKYFNYREIYNFSIIVYLFLVLYVNIWLLINKYILVCKLTQLVFKHSCSIVIFDNKLPISMNINIFGIIILISVTHIINYNFIIIVILKHMLMYPDRSNKFIRQDKITDANKLGMRDW